MPSRSVRPRVWMRPEVGTTGEDVPRVDRSRSTTHGGPRTRNPAPGTRSAGSSPPAVPSSRCTRATSASAGTHAPTADAALARPVAPPRAASTRRNTSRCASRSCTGGSRTAPPCDGAATARGLLTDRDWIIRSPLSPHDAASVGRSARSGLVRALSSQSLPQKIPRHTGVIGVFPAAAPLGRRAHSPPPSRPGAVVTSRHARRWTTEHVPPPGVAALPPWRPDGLAAPMDQPDAPGRAEALDADQPASTIGVRQVVDAALRPDPGLSPEVTPGQHEHGHGPLSTSGLRRRPPPWAACRPRRPRWSGTGPRCWPRSAGPSG
jgi:hypothetical protein